MKLGKPWVLLLQIWLVLVCASTLLVHQHVYADVVAGAVLGLATFGLLNLLSAKRLELPDHNSGQ